MSEKPTEELAPSELGTLEYWEKTYAREIENFEDHGDVGEVWFGSGSSSRVVRHIATKLNLSKHYDRIVDLGCGNGMTLLYLAEAGFERLLGLDYSEKAVDLARKVLHDDAGRTNIQLQVFDILVEPAELPADFTFKLAHDKGTYDAVSLHPAEPREKRRRYVENVYRMLEDGGMLALTSCNWTRAELIEQLGEHFEFVEELETKKFSFGGQSGNTITQLIFRKK